jgi:hypothetical protein
MCEKAVSMVYPEKINGLIGNLRRYTGHLRQLAAFPETDVLVDPIRLGAA